MTRPSPLSPSDVSTLPSLALRVQRARGLSSAAIRSFVFAARQGDWDALRAQLATEPSLALVQEHGFSGLMVACDQGHSECVRQLLPYSDATLCTTIGEDALILAAKAGHTACVELLLPHANPKQESLFVGGAWLCAAAEGRLDVLRVLMPHSDVVATETKTRRNALMLAAKRGHAHCLPWLLTLLDPAGRDHEGWTPLVIAASGGHAECVRILSHARRPDQQEASLAFGMASRARNWACLDELANDEALFRVVDLWDSLGATERAQLPRCLARIELRALQQMSSEKPKQTSTGLSPRFLVPKLTGESCGPGHEGSSSTPSSPAFKGARRRL